MLYKKLIICLSAIVTFQFHAYGQSVASGGEYMNNITTEMKDITADLWDYTSAVANGKSARKVENRRKELVTTINEALRNISRMPAFQGDKAYRDTVLSYLRISNVVLNNDFGKIIDLEDVAEQSYDAMEAYLLAKDRANDKLEEAGDRLRNQQKIFAEKNRVNLTNDKSKTGKKLESAGKVFKYYNVIYLIFFKAYKQEAYLLEAHSKNNVNAVQQNLNAMKSIVQEGLQKLDTIQAFNNDLSIKQSCYAYLMVIKAEAEGKFDPLVNYSLKKDNFEKAKKKFDAIAPSNRTQEDVDAFNAEVNSFNASTKEVNAASKELYNIRSSALDTWNKSVNDFLKKHVIKNKV